MKATRATKRASQLVNILKKVVKVDGNDADAEKRKVF
jgi:hypothetical protein